ncbi:uncharacterized protein [Anabrus simplex]|uniref:uncharacterized protein n=1 Tax=Anabrus simplex TaxID=316456 RepID=UPI0035A26F48
MMQQCEGVLLGREPVDGTVNASSLATLIRTLLASRERLCRSVGTSSIYGERRRFTIRCRDGIEIIPSKTANRPRRVDDEGFESDDDTSSTKSAASLDDTISTSSSCCFVDDHVFKFPTNSNNSSRGVTNSTSSTSSVATDSANSSGASDTDDVDTSASPSPSSGIGSVSKLVQSLSLFQSRSGVTGANKDNHENSESKASESYSVSDIAFCHTDPSFPKVIVWVVKRRRLQRLSSTGSENGGLEALVFECLNERGLKKIYSSYQEVSRRAKLDQYRHPHRRKDLYPSNVTPQSYSQTLYSSKHSEKEGSQKATILYSSSASNESSEASKSYASKTTTSYRQYNDGNNNAKPYVHLQDPPSKNFLTSPKTLPKPTSRPASQVDDVDATPLSVANKFNLVQRTDGDGVTHIEVARGVVQTSVPTDTVGDPGVTSSIISISTPDVGNMLSSATGSQKSKLCKEIEGVIRSDIDSAGGVRREPTSRQREPAILVMNGGAEDVAGSELHKVWSPPKVAEEEEDEDQLDVIVSEPPPQRPERRKHLKKKSPAPPPPVSARPSPDLVVENSKRLHIPSRSEVFLKNQQNGQQKIVRGQYIRVNVDQPSQQQQQQLGVPMPRSSSPWILSNASGSSKMVTYSSPSWIPLSPPLKSSNTSKHEHRRVLDDLFTLHSSGQKQHRRSRSSGGTGRSKSPPATRRPMAYRYIDVGNPPSTSHTNTLSNRFFGLSQKLRDIGSSSAGYPYATTGRRRVGEDDGHLSSSDCKGNLKSVIKKGKRAGEYVEPKKVTFSAYATVQVVD